MSTFRVSLFVACHSFSLSQMGTVEVLLAYLVGTC